MSRSRIVSAETPPRSVGGVLRRRTRSKAKEKAAEILPFDSHEALLGYLKGPLMQEFREGDYIHVSDLIHKCARKIALSKRLGVPMASEPLFDSTSLTFAQGEAMASFIVSKVRDKVPRNLYGIWGCACGKTKKEGTRHSVLKDKCDVCGHGLDVYHEYCVKDDELRLSGSIDLLLREDSAFTVTELKSIKRDAWEELGRPVPEHLIQVLFYWYLMRKAGHPLHDKVSILYAVKDYVFKSPYKEFVIQPSPILDRLTEYLEDAEALRDSIHNGGPLPPRVTCATQDSPAAKKCQFCESCFEL